MASKGINNENLNVRDQRAAETRRAKKAAKAAALGKGGSKKAAATTFSMADVIEDKKNRPLNKLNRELETNGEVLGFSEKAHRLCKEHLSELVTNNEQAKHALREFAILGVNFKGDFNFDMGGLGLETIQNEWPSLKVWAFGAKHGECLNYGKHFPSVLKGQPSWMTIIRIA